MSNDGQGLNDYGSIISRRRLQIKYAFQGFETAVIMPYINFSNADDIAYSKKDTNSQYIFYQIPRIETAYHYENKYLYLKPFLSYGIYLYRLNNNNSSAHIFTAGTGGKVKINDFFLDFMVYFGQNMYLNSSYGGYSGLAKSINPVFIENNKISINNFYSTGGGIGLGYNYKKTLFQLGAGYNSNFNNKFFHIQSTFGTYFNVKYNITKYLSILFETAYLSNFYDNTNTNKGSALITGGMAILSF